jgi:tetratricopeptide (TPR) repeat protein/peroxiredoxin
LAYRNAWQATNRLLRQGHSFSGHESNCVYLNCRNQQFANVSSVTGLDFTDDGRALVVTDWDQDGDLDVWLGNRTGPRLRLMRNSTIAAGTNRTDHTYVAFRLQGTKSNRDAIGARVTVECRQPTADSRQPNPLLIQTVRAGDAFLSQSSKWLHFGLGSDAEVVKVEIRWPSGHVEHFPNIRAGGRFDLVEGSGQAIAIPPTTRAIALVPGKQEQAPSSPASRMYFSSRVPMPLLAYEPFDTGHPIEDSTRRTPDTRHLTPITSSGRPLLITLWASWCQPCLVELHEMSQQAESLRAIGLDVLALSVDGLDTSQPTTAADARAALQRLAFPFASGTATPEMLDKLSVVESIVMNYEKGLAVPTSYLFDSDGHLAVAYKGPLDLAQLQHDVSQVDVPIVERRNLAAALSGRWISPPRQLLMRAVARTFRDHGYNDDFTRYLKLDAEVIERQLAAARTDQERQELTKTFAHSNFNLGMTLAASGELAEAVTFFQRAIELAPEHVEALINLGAIYGRARNSELAVQTLERAVELSPDSIPARLNLAVALTASGEFATAVPHYEKVLSAEPDNAGAHSQLARSLVELGRIEAASEHLEKAVELNPQDFAATLTLAWLQATSPIDAVRDGASAGKLAQRLHSATGGGNPMLLDVLAAAFAEQGDFESAKATIRDALARLGDANPAVRQTLSARLKQYEANQPHRDEDGKYP